MFRFVCLILMLVMATSSTHAATTVSFDAGASSVNALRADETAGVVAAENWNLLSGSGRGIVGDTYTNAFDSFGVETTIDVSISSADELDWQQNVWHGFSGSNQRLAQDITYVNGAGDTFAVEFDEIGFESYDIYLYTGAGGTSRGGSITDGSTTYFVRGFEAGGGTEEFVEGTETESFANATSADYVVFRGLTGSSQSFEFEAIDTQIFFSGAQIVGNPGTPPASAASTSAVPEPSSALIFSLVGFGLVTRRRRRK